MFDMSALRNRASLLLALLYAGESPTASAQRSTPIEGITRLEKLLFILRVRERLLSEVIDDDTYHFIPFRMGPWTQEVYDEVDFLESLGLLTKTTSPERSAADDAHDQELFSSAIIDKWQRDTAISSHGTETYQLSDAGIAKASELWAKLTPDERTKVLDVKRRFNHMNLKQLLRYVYKEFPQYATESEIRDALGV
jgi:uncharacterized protein YwgA